MSAELPDRFKIPEWDEFPSELKNSTFLYSYFDERYHRELDRRKELSDVYFSHISILALIAGGFVTAGSILTKYNLPLGGWPLITLIFMAAGVIALIASLIFATRSVFRSYGYMPNSKEILMQAKELVVYLRAKNPGLSANYIQDELDIEIRSDLSKFYAEFGALNADSNIRKTADMHNARIGKTIAMVCCAAIFVGVYLVQVKYDKTEKRVEVNIAQFPSPMEVSVTKIPNSIDTIIKSSIAEKSLEKCKHDRETTNTPSSSPKASPKGRANSN